PTPRWPHRDGGLRLRFRRWKRQAFPASMHRSGTQYGCRKERPGTSSLNSTQRCGLLWLTRRCASKWPTRGRKFLPLNGKVLKDSAPTNRPRSRSGGRSSKRPASRPIKMIRCLEDFGKDAVTALLRVTAFRTQVVPSFKYEL